VTSVGHAWVRDFASQQPSCRIDRTMRLPSFLVIGAMKAGTTSLCQDLQSNPDVFFPSVKEPHFLCTDQILTPSATKQYAALFRNAQPHQMCGEGSTGYSKLPDIRGVPDRALQVIGSKLKLIYIVREPVARAISHHYHLYRAGNAIADINEAVRSTSALIEYGRYALQLRPWLKIFGRENVFILPFEEYITKRRQSTAEVSQFLGITPRPELVVAEKIHNAAEDLGRLSPVVMPIVRAMTRSKWYKVHIHPRMPRCVSRCLKSAVSGDPPPRPAPPSLTTVKHVIDRVREDEEELRCIMGRVHPIWDREERLQRFL